jgi:hypothetical protein
VESRGIEVRAVRPDERPGLSVQRHGIERRRVLQRSEERPAKDPLEIDALFGTVAKCHNECERTDDAEPCHSMDWMAHDLPEWFDLDGRLPGLQQIPVVLQLFPVDLRPSLDQPLLRPGQAAAAQRLLFDAVSATARVWLRAPG